MGRKTMAQIYLKDIHAEQYGKVFFLERLHSYKAHALIQVNQPFTCTPGWGCSAPILPGDFAAIVFYFQEFDGAVFCRNCVCKTLPHWQKVLKDNPA